MSEDKPTKIEEKTPIQTNLRAILMSAGAIAIAVWWASNWMSSVTSRLDTHSSSIATLNSQLSDLKTGQDRNFERLLAAIEGRRFPGAAAAAAAPRPESAQPER